MNTQEFYDRCASSLRMYGSMYNRPSGRLWGWVNDANPAERCAIARFINGTDSEVETQVSLLMLKNPQLVPIKNAVVWQFDSFPMTVNNPARLEQFLYDLAALHGLKYKQDNVEYLPVGYIDSVTLIDEPIVPPSIVSTYVKNVSINTVKIDISEAA